MQEKHDLDFDQLLKLSLKSRSSNPRFLSRSNPSPFINPNPVPFNTPAITPSNSYEHLLGPQTQGDLCLGSPDTPLKSFSVSRFSMADMTLNGDYADDREDDIEDFWTSDSVSTDSLLLAASREPEHTNLPKGIGLGITGLTKNDGSGPFDGLGLVSIRRWTAASRLNHMKISPNVESFLPYSRSTSSTFSLSPDQAGELELSNTFLQEALFTFTQDPLHEHSLATIPECRSWYEMDGDGISSSASIILEEESEDCQSDLQSNRAPKSEARAPLTTTRRHFSCSTISSELKRMSPSAKFIISRTRSATWPSHSGNQQSRLLPGRPWRA